jgi:TPR repeat protein/serine/threonine protein kinase
LIEARNQGGTDEQTLLEAQPPPTPGGGVGLNLVPGAQFLEYRLVEPIKVASGEAELWVADGGGRRVVLKFYRWGLHPKAGLTEKLSRISKSLIVEVYGRGTSPDGRDYEILEFIRHGTLADFGKGGLPEIKVREVLRELTDAVAALHAENILHRDLKPANVLVRTIQPLNLVLTDFGISSVMDISLHVTSVNRTAAYSAPEAMTGVVSKASDWWSVGVMVMEMLQGAQPFAGLDERAINFALVMRGITVPKEIPTEWQSLLKGLLTRDHAKRWNELQIGQWLDGRTNIPVYYNDATATPVMRIRKNRPCQFLKTDYFEPAELALAMAQQWDEAVKRFERGIISEWLKKEVQNADLASLLIDIQEDSSLDAEQKLSVCLLAMNDQLPLSWRGEVVNQDWMATHPAIGVAFLKSGISTWLKTIRQDAWLEELKRRYSEFQSRIENPCDEETILKAALATDAALLESGQTARRDYYSSTDAQLNKLLSKRHLTPLEAAILALAPPTCFVTRWTAAKEHVTEFSSNIKLWGGCAQALIQFPTTKSALDARVAHLHESRGKLEKELESILGGGPVPSLLQPAVKVVNDLQAGFDSLLAERLSAENEVSNVLPHQLQPDRFDRITKRLNAIEQRFSDIDCSQLKHFIRIAQRTNAETLILNELPQQLGACQLRTTKQRLQDIKSQFPDIDCAEIETSIAEWEAFYHDLSLEMDRIEHDMRVSYCAGFGKRFPNITKQLQERLLQFKTNLDQREAQLNDQYKDTEFGELGLEELARLRRRLAEVDARKANIQQQFKMRVANGVFWMFIGACAMLVGIWMLLQPEAGGTAIDSIMFAAGATGIICGFRLLRLNRTTTIKFCGGIAALLVLVLLLYGIPRLGFHRALKNVRTASFKATNSVLDYSESLKNILQAAKHGDAGAQFDFGKSNYTGNGMPTNYAEAVDWFRKSADQGNAKAQCNLGVCYHHGDGVALDYSEAIKWFSKAAEQGLSQAEDNLGSSYFYAEGVAQDYAMAVYWYRKAAEQGDAVGQDGLGACYIQGTGVAQDYTEGVKWLLKAAEQGDAEAQYGLAKFYYAGKDGNTNHPEALIWFQKAAEQGNISSCSILGALYMVGGEGVKQDFSAAAKWLSRAAEQGDPSSQDRLGLLYWSGKGVAQNYPYAVKWFREAAGQGNADADYHLGGCLINGNGVMKDWTEATRWLLLAFVKGQSEAPAALDNIIKSLPQPTDQAKVQQALEAAKKAKMQIDSLPPDGQEKAKTLVDTQIGNDLIIRIRSNINEN